MGMRTITRQIEMLVNRRVNKCNAPGFPDCQSVFVSTLGYKAVHASIKIGVFKLHIPEKLGNSLFLPV
jgi:hypothetical protein